MSQFFASGGQSIGASASVLPVKIKDRFPLGLTCLILQSKGLSRVFSQHHSSKSLVLQHSAFFIVQLSHPYITTRKTVTLAIQTFLGKVTSLLFNMLSRFVRAFLPRNKHLLISWLWWPSAMILEPPGHIYAYSWTYTANLNFPKLFLEFSFAHKSMVWSWPTLLCGLALPRRAQISYSPLQNLPQESLTAPLLVHLLFSFTGTCSWEGWG